MKIFKISKKALYIFYEIKIHQLCQFLSKIELIKYLFFSLKIQVFRVKNFDMLKNVTLKKQTNNRKLGCLKIKNYAKHQFGPSKNCKLLNFKQVN